MKFFNLQDHVNLLTIIAVIALFAVTFFVSALYFKKMKERKSDDMGVGEDDWDGIREGKNDLPIGWAISFVALIVWAIWYFLVGYPLNSYSQIGEYNDEVRNYNQKFENIHKDADESTLMAMGEGIFLVECAPCHGIDAEGMNNKARNLKLWGNEASIIETIKVGSSGMNYPLGAMPEKMVSDDEAKAIAAYVAKDISEIKSTSNEQLVNQGKELWTTCAACHGDDGKGMDNQAPNLTEFGSYKFVLSVLERGKLGSLGHMPAFNDGRLSEIQKRAVSKYVSSLSKNK